MELILERIAKRKTYTIGAKHPRRGHRRVFNRHSREVFLRHTGTYLARLQERCLQGERPFGYPRRPLRGGHLLLAQVQAVASHPAGCAEVRWHPHSCRQLLGGHRRLHPRRQEQTCRSGRRQPHLAPPPQAENRRSQG